MIDSAAWDQVADRVNADDFYRNDHRLIFSATAGLIERNQPCDAVTLSGILESQGLLDQVGGLSYLGTLARDTPTAANIKAYADIVRERSVLRQLISAGNSIVSNALEPEGREAREIVDDAERAVFEIADFDLVARFDRNFVSHARPPSGAPKQARGWGHIKGHVATVLAPLYRQGSGTR